MTINLFSSIGTLLVALAFFQNIVIAAGMIKNKNTYTILHISCVSDSLALATSLIGVAMLEAGNKTPHEALKLLFLCALVYICNPVSGYIISKIAYFYQETEMDASPRRGKNKQ